MNTPTISSITERLEQVIKKIGLLHGVHTIPHHSLAIEAEQFVARNRWLPSIPTFQNVQKWIEFHWATDRQTRPLSGVICQNNSFGSTLHLVGATQNEHQLDSLIATSKLILAAAKYDIETIGKHAEDFAMHGMIEGRRIYVLKGATLSERIDLDEYCALLPYRTALQNLHTDRLTQDSLQFSQWPPEDVQNVCALEIRVFQEPKQHTDNVKERTSPLLRYGPETLMLILGLIWGRGLRIFGGDQDVPETIDATLPFAPVEFMGRGAGTEQALLTLLRSNGPPPRPLNCAELKWLIDRFSQLKQHDRAVLYLALRRLRDSTERISIDLEDQVIDLGISLEALFSNPNERIQTAVSRRGSWYYADSAREREQTHKLLGDFYRDRSKIVHGGVSRTRQSLDRRKRRREGMVVDIDNIIRTSIKSMIAEGPPTDSEWENSNDSQSIRHDPPRTDADILSVKSDSLSWSVKEQREIDQALEAMWQPTVEDAPTPTPDTTPTTFGGINRDEIATLRRKGIYYIIIVPARLYMVHPKWHEPIDERARYYCQKDVERHMQRWRQAANEKRVSVFDLQDTSAASHRPRYLKSHWHNSLKDTEPNP